MRPAEVGYEDMVLRVVVDGPDGMPLRVHLTYRALVGYQHASRLNVTTPGFETVSRPNVCMYTTVPRSLLGHVLERGKHQKAKN